MTTDPSVLRWLAYQVGGLAASFCTLVLALPLFPLVIIPLCALAAVRHDHLYAPSHG